MKKLRTKCGAGLASVAIAAWGYCSAQAAVVGINFQDDWGDGGGAAVTDTALGVPVANWFNMPRVPSSGSTAFATNQVITVPGGGTLEISWQAVNTWSLTADIPTAGDDQVIYGYLDDSGTGYAVTLSGMRNFAGTYQIATIASSDGASGFTDAVVSFQTETNSLQYLNNQFPTYAGGLWGLSTTSSVVSALNTNNVVRIVGSPRSGQDRSTLAGILISYTPGLNNAPMVERQPQAPTGTIFSAQPFSLSVAASGSAPLGYQWRKGGVPISQATNSTFAKAAAAGLDSGIYDVVITNSLGAVTSAPVTITISEVVQPVITRAPLNESVYPGYPVTLSVQAIGGELAYQWSKDGTALPGETNSTLTIAAATQASQGAYTVLVSNIVGTTSATANLVVKSPVAGSLEAAVASRKPELYFRMNETGLQLQPQAANSGSLGNAAAGMYVGAVRRPVQGAIVASTDTAASFEGGRVSAKYSPALNPNGSFTVEVWAKPNVTSGSRVLVQSMINGENPDNSSDRSGWSFRQTGADLTVLWGSQNVYSDTPTASNAVVAGVWSHYSFVYDSTANTLTMYVNGAVVKSVTPAAPLEPNTAAPIIVGDRGFGGWTFNGMLDEVAIYGKALTGAQLLAHYQNGISANPATPYSSLVTADGPLLYLRLNEGPQVPNAMNAGTLGSSWNGTYTDAGGIVGEPRMRLGEPGPRPPQFVGFESTNTAMSVTNAFLLAPQVSLGNNVSVAGWLYREAPETGDGDLGWVAWLGDGGFHINPDGELRYHWKGGQWGWSSGLRVPTNVWTFVALVVEPTRATIYMTEGTEVRSAVNNATHAAMVTSSPVGFAGNQPGRADRRYRGKQDEFGVWNRALTADEVGFLAASALGIQMKISIVPGGIIPDTDPSGIANHGLNMGSVWVASNTDAGTPARTRTAVQQFSAATGGQIVVAASGDLNSTTGTIMFWMRAPAPIPGPGSEGSILFDRRAVGNAGGGDVLVLKDDGSLMVQAETPPGRTSANTFTAGYLPDDLWHHVAYVYDQSLSGSTTLYVDGVAIGSNPNATNWAWASAQPLEIGKSHDTYWKRFEGFMDDFRVYNRALTPAEVSQVFASDAVVDAAALKVRYEFRDTGIGKSLVWPFGVLESTTTLGPSADWQPVPGARSPYPFLPTEGNRFFRIRL